MSLMKGSMTLSVVIIFLLLLKLGWMFAKSVTNREFEEYSSVFQG